jgi:hypothetical protein
VWSNPETRYRRLEVKTVADVVVVKRLAAVKLDSLREVIDQRNLRHK